MRKEKLYKVRIRNSREGKRAEVRFSIRESQFPTL